MVTARGGRGGSRRNLGDVVHDEPRAAAEAFEEGVHALLDGPDRVHDALARLLDPELEERADVVLLTLRVRAVPEDVAPDVGRPALDLADEVVVRALSAREHEVPDAGLEDEARLALHLDRIDCARVDGRRAREGMHVLEEDTGGGADAEPARNVDGQDIGAPCAELGDPSLLGIGEPDHRRRGGPGAVAVRDRSRPGTARPGWVLTSGR